MTLTVRRLAPGDETILTVLATDNADFDLAGRGEPEEPPNAAAALRYLVNSAVLHWIASDDDAVVGSLYCIYLPQDTDEGGEILLYDIGVRQAWRRRGVGRALLVEMERWMHEHGIGVVWVLADNPAAVEFYEACSFVTEEKQPVYMTRQLKGSKPTA